jgi:hypothetical protein
MLAGGVYLIYGDTKTSTVARKQARIHLKHPTKRAKAELKKLLKKLKKPATKRKIQKIQAALFGGRNERKLAQQRCRRSGEVLGHG